MLAYPMKRTTIKISEELDTKLRHIAAQRNGTLSEVIREALELYANGKPGTCGDRFCSRRGSER